MRCYKKFFGRGFDLSTFSVFMFHEFEVVFQREYNKWVVRVTERGSEC